MTIRNNDAYMVPKVVLARQAQGDVEQLAALLARFLVGGDLLRLEGDLGAGKSTFARALLGAMGHRGDVPSPTYTLVQEYADTRLPVCHVDAYRLKSEDEMAGLGVADYLRHGVIIAEWPQQGGAVFDLKKEWVDYHIQSVLCPGTLTVAMEAEDADTRTITLTGSPSWQRRFALMFPHMARPSEAARREAFLATTAWAGCPVEGLGADWSYRSYWRVRRGEERCLLMDSPPPQEGVEAYAAVAAYYNSVGVRAPQVYALDPREGYMLLEEFDGEALAAKAKRGEDVTAWYAVAVDVLTALCRAQPPADARVYGLTDWIIECKAIADYGWPLAYGHAATIDQRMHMEATLRALYPHVKDLPRGLLPWDYQATNMICMGDVPAVENFGLIDIQDARVEPVTQDMALLLRDIRRGQDDALENAMLAHAATMLGVDEAALRLGLEVSALQQHVRIAGSLCRFAVREQKTAGPMAFLPRVWEVIRQGRHVPELQDVMAWLLPMEEPMMAALKRLAHEKAA